MEKELLKAAKKISDELILKPMYEENDRLLKSNEVNAEWDFVSVANQQIELIAKYLSELKEKWLNESNRHEKQGIDSMKLWITRDLDGGLFISKEMPHKEEDQWYTDSPSDDFIGIDEGLFPEIKWEDAEPKQVEIKLITEQKGS
ncbi:MAG: hypothetical protein PVH88_02055 [Ignavibacteria bacterium]|jgi:hypothetical protein